MYLKTGFVGTPYLCRVLSENGCNEMAYKLLLNKDYPSWLYAVTMGATTIWERWNSVLPDGKISGTGYEFFKSLFIWFNSRMDVQKYVWNKSSRR